MRFTLTALALCAMGAHALVMEKRDGYAVSFGPAEERIVLTSHRTSLTVCI